MSPIVRRGRSEVRGPIQESDEPARELTGSLPSWVLTGRLSAIS